MTTNEPAGDPESESNRAVTPAIQEVEPSVDEGKATDHVQLSEPHIENEFQKQQVKDGTAALPEKDELEQRFADPNAAATVDRHQREVGRQLADEEVTNVQHEGGENSGDVEESHSQGAIELDNLEPGREQARLLADPTQLHGTSWKPPSSKDAVQDPSVIEITPSATDNGVIDVDTFDDDVSEDEEADPSPAVDETNAELQDANEQSNDETQAMMLHGAQGEPIDLTVSPSIQPKMLPTLHENDPNINIEDRIEPERSETTARGDVIDVDEPEGQAEDNLAIETTKQSFGAEGLNSSPVEEDEKHGKGTTDTETVSADLSVDLNVDDDDVSPGEAPIASNTLESAAERERESGSLQDRSRVVEHNEEEEQSAKDNRIGSEDGVLDAQVNERTSKTDDGIDVTDTSAGKPKLERGEPLMAQDDSEDDDIEDDSASGQEQQENEDNEAEENGSPTAPQEVASFEHEGPEEIDSGGQNEVQMDVREKESHRGEARSQPFTDAQDMEATSRTKQTHERTARPGGDDLSPFDVMSEDHAAPMTTDGASEPIEHKEVGETDASAITTVISKEKAMAKTVVRDLSVAHAHAVVSPDPVPHETIVSKELEIAASVSDPPPPRDDNTKGPKIDVVMGAVEGENNPKNVSDSTVPLMVEASCNVSNRETQGPRVSERERDRITEAVPILHRGSSTASGAVMLPPEGNAKSSVEQSKSANAGHLAPMFGIQLSRPIKTGPVSFSSPPSFPRYSLNPQAVPYLPAKRRKNESLSEPTDASVTRSAAVSQPSNGVKARDTEALNLAVEKDDQTKATEAVDVPHNNMETAPTTPHIADFPIASAKSQISNVNALEDAMTETARPTSTGGLTQAASEIKAASNAKSSVKRPAQKKVSFAPTPIKREDPLPNSERDQAVEGGSVPTEASRAREQRKNVTVAQPDRVIDKAEGEKPAKPDRGLVEAGLVKEGQQITQVQTDEGLRREVNNVTVAMRPGNSKVRPERKKFTVRLTTGTQEKAKLQFFKASGQSLKLYASLDSSKDNLRVRKVTNRQYVMSVAKVAPPGDDTADIVVKYFLHFDERDTFEEMYSQCVANLQKKAKPIARTKKPEEHSKVSQAVVEELKEDSNRLSPKSGGVKRFAESDNAAQVSKKSKLLADKKKLLDKMAALRKKKEQKGTSVAKERQITPFAKAVPLGGSGSIVSDKGATNSLPLKSMDLPAKPKSKEKDSVVDQENLPTSGDRVQRSKKRTAENMNDETSSKKARLPISRPTSHETGVARAPPSDRQPQILKVGPAESRSKRDELKERSVVARSSHSVAETNGSNVDAELSQTNPGELLRRKEVPGGLAPDEQNSKEAEALVKVTRDLKQSEDEKKALQSELESRNRVLRAEREKSLRVQQESSNAWQTIVRTVEALGADIECLRREDTDRSLESLTRCEASSSEDFFDRLHSFRPSTWAAFENTEIGALECALKGWYNSGPRTIRSSEGSEITLRESFDDSSFRQGEIERVRSLLREGHCLLSGWIGRSSPESFRTLEGSQRMLTREQLKANSDSLRRVGLEILDLRFDWGASALLVSDDICDKLAVYNWCLDGECLRCSWCNRRVIVDGESRFDAKSKHYAFCPFRAKDWKKSVLRNATTLGIEDDDDVGMKDQPGASVG